MLELNILTIQLHLFSIQMIWMMFLLILMIIIKKRKRKVLIVFDDMIADIMSSKKFKAITKELFIRCSKLNIYIVFIA